MAGFSRLEEQGSSTHAACGGDGGDESRDGGHYYLGYDFDDAFLFVVHSFSFWFSLLDFVASAAAAFGEELGGDLAAHTFLDGDGLQVVVALRVKGSL